MPEERTTRRLAAILAADVVGYSRMMAANEAGTLAALKRHRESLFDPAVAAHNGRIVKLIGDGTLVEFGSVVDAVQCALAVQKEAAGGAAPDNSRITLRIGINLGDVIIDGDDIYGDGVNVAARLEPLAEPGGICVSSIVNESVGSRIEDSFRDGGEVQVKNIDRPIRVWKWSPANDAGARPIQAPSAPAKPGPSIAVLPFANMSGDPEQEYFSDGITEDLITDLSKIGGLLVIARNSSFAYKGRHVDVRTIATELRVRTVLEGSIRRAGNRIRITAQLIDAETGGHVWAERYDRDLTDIFAVQDDVTQQIVNALKIQLTPGERAALASPDTTQPEALDLFLRARGMLLTPTKDPKVFDRALLLFNRAIELDPDYSKAYAGISMAHRLNYVNNWTGAGEQSLVEASRFAEIAITKNPNELSALQAVAMAATSAKDFAKARAAVERAQEISPNNSEALFLRCVYEVFAGNSAEAIRVIERAMRLDPLAGRFVYWLGTAYLIAGKFETAAALFRERIVQAPEADFARALLISALGHLGRADEARQVWADLKAIKPDFSFSEHLARLSFRNPADVELISQGFRKSGVQE